MSVPTFFNKLSVRSSYSDADPSYMTEDQDGNLKLVGGSGKVFLSGNAEVEDRLYLNDITHVRDSSIRFESNGSIHAIMSHNGLRTDEIHSYNTSRVRFEDDIEYKESEGVYQNLKTKIQSIETDVSSNTTAINTNTTDITTNTSNIATNTSNIATNTSNIATNTSDIATLQSTVNTNTANIATNTTDISTNTTDITTLQTTVNGKQNTLTAGTNITINGDTINAVLTEGSYTFNSPLSETNSVVDIDLSAYQPVITSKVDIYEDSSNGRIDLKNDSNLATITLNSDSGSIACTSVACPTQGSHPSTLTRKEYVDTEVATKQNTLTDTDDIKISSLVLGTANNPLPVNDGGIYAYSANIPTISTTNLTVGSNSVISGMTGKMYGHNKTTFKFVDNYSGDTVHYLNFNETNKYMDSDYYAYVTPTADTNTANQGIQIKNQGHYRISYNFIFVNEGYTGSDNQYIKVTPMKNTSNSSISQHSSYSDITEAGSTTRGNNSNTFMQDFAVDDYIKFEITCAKDNTSYNENLNKVKFNSCTFCIEYLGPV